LIFIDLQKQLFYNTLIFNKSNNLRKLNILMVALGDGVCSPADRRLAVPDSSEENRKAARASFFPKKMYLCTIFSLRV
jgi:hypothetical protein